MSTSVTQKLSYKPRSVKMLAQLSMGAFGVFFFALALLLDEPTDETVLVSTSQASDVGSAANDEPEQTWRNY